VHRRRVRGIVLSRSKPGVFQIRIHGRGGQGVVTAAELLSVAAFREGFHAQAFPSFGSERTGAPVVAFCRLDDKPIRLREPVMRPDALIIQDPTLLHQVDVFSGLAPDGIVLVNTARSAADLGLDDFVRGRPAGTFCTVPATDLALANIGKPYPNAALLGGFAALSGRISIDSVCSAIRERFSGRVAEANVVAAVAAHAHVAGAQPEQTAAAGVGDAQAD
jgi:pyruvate ferredoxin oxidoreductase gamma subunit